MSLARGNEFQLQLINSRIGGVVLTPGNNTFPAPAVLFDSGNADWWPVGSGDAYEIEIGVDGIAVSGANKDALLRIYYESAVSSVDSAADTITYATPHGLETADGPSQMANSGGALPTGIAAATDYWIIRVDDYTIKYATSEANARAGTAVDITANGSGTQTTTSCKLIDLACGDANLSITSSAPYRFPLWVPRLTKIMGAISVASATVGTANVNLYLACKPTKPWALQTITYVRTFGSTPASSNGTAFTPGNNAKGAYTQVGTTVEDLRFWAVGENISATAVGNTSQFVDLAIDNAGVKRIALGDVWHRTGTTETIDRTLRNAWMQSFSGETIHVRAQNGGAPVAGFTAIAYGGGGQRIEPASASCTVAGTVTIAGAPAANGKTVKIFAVDSDGLVELVTTTTTAGGAGGFTVDVPEATRSYFASYVDGASIGRSADGTPESSTFDIAIGSGGGSGATLIASNYQGDFSVRKNEPNADDRVAGPMPFYDNAGQLLTGQTFDNAAHEVQVWNADTGTFADANADTTEAASKGLYYLQLSQAETNHGGGGIIVKLAKATYADQFFAVPLRTWQKTEADSVAQLATDYTTARAGKLDFLDVAISSRLAPTVAARTLDVSAGGEAGIDWANIGSPTTAQALTNTTLKLTATGIDEILDEALAGHTTAGTFGKAISDILAAVDTEIAAIKAKTDQMNFTGTFLDVQVRGMDTDVLGSAALAATAVAEIQSGLATGASLATAQADLDDIQSRIPAALTGAGNMKADALAISGDTTAADNLELQFDGTGLVGATFPARQDAITALPAAIEDAVLDALLADHVAAGSVGAALGALGNPFDQISEDSVTYGDAIRLITSIVAGVVQNFTTNTSAFKSLNGAKTRRTFTYSPLGRIAAVTGDLT